jgi:multidrug efflux system outer membrane protein
MRWQTLSCLGLAGALAACSLAPEMPAPDVQAPAAWKETPAQIDGDWKAAMPADDAARGEWWRVFRDPVLDNLVSRASAGNASLAVAFARLEQARSRVQVASAARLPSLDLGVGASRIQPSTVVLNSFGGVDGIDMLKDYTQLNTKLGASYEVDLFGRVRDAVQAARADYAAEQALFASLQLSLQGDVAQTYFLIRSTDADLIVVEASVKLREEAVALLEVRRAAGEVGDFDVERQVADLEIARSELHALRRARAEYEHALAVLCGEAPAAFTLAPAPLAVELPEIPVSLPSVLLERRPDVAAAERRMQAANARIGVARAAFYPVLNLTANFGVESGGVGELFKWSSRTWALGPIAGPLLSLPIFDGGRNKANLASAEAGFDAEAARYRQTVLDAFAEVENGLSGLRTLAAQREAIARGIKAAEHAYEIARVRYESGATGYLEVLDARRTLVAVRRLEAQLKGARASTTVGLIRALGGGW